MRYECGIDVVSEKPLPSEIRPVWQGVRFDSPVTCPECGGSLEIVVDEWDAATGRPKEEGFRLICCREEEISNVVMSVHECYGNRHYLCPSVWETAIDNAYKWLIKTEIRVPTENGKGA